jgi:hypothetical protein
MRLSWWSGRCNALPSHPIVHALAQQLDCPAAVIAIPAYGTLRSWKTQPEVKQACPQIRIAWHFTAANRKLQARGVRIAIGGMV